jgi:hypothetical protein
MKASSVAVVASSSDDHASSSDDYAKGSLECRDAISQSPFLSGATAKAFALIARQAEEKFLCTSYQITDYNLAPPRGHPGAPYH